MLCWYSGLHVSWLVLLSGGDKLSLHVITQIFVAVVLNVTVV